MTDIITNAQQLLDGATPAPWTAEIESFTENEGGDFSLQAAILAEGEPLMTADDGMVYHKEGNFDLAAAAPELAQALAEETYEYAVQVKLGAKWLFLGRGTGGHNFARNAFWFVEKEKAQDYMVIGKDMSAPARLVRRRVSPSELIEDA